MNKQAILEGVMESDELVTKTLWPSTVKIHSINVRALEEILNSLPDENEIAKRLFEKFATSNKIKLAHTVGSLFYNWLDSREEECKICRGRGEVAVLSSCNPSDGDFHYETCQCAGFGEED